MRLIKGEESFETSTEELSQEQLEQFEILMRTTKFKDGALLLDIENFQLRKDESSRPAIRPGDLTKFSPILKKNVRIKSITQFDATLHFVFSCGYKAIVPVRKIYVPKANVLVYESGPKKGKPVKAGDKVVSSKGEKTIVLGWRIPHKPGSTGRVIVKESWRAFGEAEYFPSVFNMTWAEEASS